MGLTVTVTGDDVAEIRGILDTLRGAGAFTRMGPGKIQLHEGNPEIDAEPEHAEHDTDEADTGPPEVDAVITPASATVATPDHVATVPDDTTANTSEQQGTPADDIPAELDIAGVAWDARVHSPSKLLNADKTWRAKRGCDKALLAEVRAAAGAPSTVPPPAGDAAATPPPPPPPDGSNPPPPPPPLTAQQATATNNGVPESIKLCATILAAYTAGNDRNDAARAIQEMFLRHGLENGAMDFPNAAPELVPLIHADLVQIAMTRGIVIT